MNKTLLLLSLLVANLQALPETLPTDKKPFPFMADKKQELPELPKRSTIEDLLPSCQKLDLPSAIAHQEDSAPLMPRKASIIKDYAHNQIVITITGVKTDSLVIASETGDSGYINTATFKTMYHNCIYIEDNNGEIAHISISQKNINDYGFYVFPVNCHCCNEDAYGECSYCDDLQISYSKQQQTITIAIPFKFARKILPIEIKN
jgi:hypothetical protein